MKHRHNVGDLVYFNEELHTVIQKRFSFNRCYYRLSGTNKIVSEKVLNG